VRARPRLCQLALSGSREGAREFPGAVEKCLEGASSSGKPRSLVLDAVRESPIDSTVVADLEALEGGHPKSERLPFSSLRKSFSRSPGKMCLGPRACQSERLPGEAGLES
jgi:hypothetical protein